MDLRDKDKCREGFMVTHRKADSTHHYCIQRDPYKETQQY